uniref:Uncharacterized protein LOC100373061 n=1 Tax=Saccoglossus kowalevskii TaxID=10224 RepID=A0ABM0M6Q7_SACKO|nr:PREDICTED: uncharacterized protein LOC100373061 [Saccoglossus kowalevskii]
MDFDSSDAIAVVGIACRFPGANDLDEYWRVLSNGENHLREIPKERWNNDAFYSNDKKEMGKNYVRHAAFIDRYDEWDNRFFQINDDEAMRMDPQQNILLECVYKALENGGFPVNELAGSNVGTYIGDCAMAVCGGINLILSPTLFISLSRARMASATGKCQPFSADADGYARGEGCGVVVLKPLQKAIKDGDIIWGVIGTGCNQDGHFATPITAPSGKQQEELLNLVYAKYKVDPSMVTYIEAHGTGTPVGDPIEANSLGHFIGQARSQGKPPCYVGSVKSNIGHLEAGAGVAGLIKVLLMMKYRKIPATLHFSKANKKINFAELCLKVPTEFVDWKVNEGDSLTACVNSFGFGGTNAHAIVTSYSKLDFPRCSQEKSHIIALSAKTRESLILMIKHLKRSIQQDQPPTLSALAYTSTVRRTHYRYRFAVASSNIGDVSIKLEKATDSILTKKFETKQEMKTVFVFCGMGTDWDGMGLDLLESEPIFRSTMLDIDNILKIYTKWSLIEKLKDGNNTSTLVSQLSVFAIQVAIAQLWITWGINPDAIVGHSMGEVAAGYISGRFPLLTAVKIIYNRAHLLEKVSGGKMLVLGELSLKEVEDYCQMVDGKVEIAAINSSTSYTISGDSEAIMKIDELIQKNNTNKTNTVFHQTLNVNTAFHSHHTQTICKEFSEQLNGMEVNTSENSIQLYSTVTGQKAVKDDFTTGQYWQRNVRSKVMFKDAMFEAMQCKGHAVVVEIGPIPALQRYIKEAARNISHTVLPSMMRGKGKITMQNSLCQLYELGMKINWKAVYSDHPEMPISVPQYQFQRMSHWYEPEKSYQRRNDLEEPGRMSYAFVKRIPNQNMTFKCAVTEANLAFVYDHKVGGTIIVPGVTYAELALESCFLSIENSHSKYGEVSVEFLTPLVVTKEAKEIMLTLQSTSEESFTFEATCGNDLHAKGQVSVNDKKKPMCALNIEEIQARCSEEINIKKVYKYLRKQGFEYGPMIHVMKQGWRNNTEAFAIIEVAEEIIMQLSSTVLHPVIIDGMLQVVGIVLATDSAASKAAFPVSVGKLIIRDRPTGKHYIYTRLINNSDFLAICSTVLLNESGEIIAEAHEIVLQFLDQDNGRIVSQLAYEMKWCSINRDIDSKIGYGSDPGKPMCVVFADTLCLADKLKSCIHNESVFLYDTTDNLTGLNGAIKMFEDFTSSEMSFDHIFYFWGILDNKDIYNMYTSILSVCISLRNVINILISKGLNIPLTVVTYGTQISSKSVINTTKYNGLIGAPLWGMVRCLLRESTYNTVKLVDLNDGTENEVYTLANVLFTGVANEYPEMSICGPDVCVNKFHHIKADKEYFKKRFNRAVNEMAIKVVSRNSHILRSVYCVKIPRHKKLTNTTAHVQISAVCLHNPNLFPITTLGLTSSDFPLWSESSLSGFDMMGLDFIGKLTSDLSSCTNVHVCCPAVVESFIQVPPALVVKSSDLPAWMKNVPCLSLMVLVWKILTSQTGQSILNVFGKKEYPLLFKLLLMYAKVCDVRVDDSNNLSNDENKVMSKPMTIVYLGQMRDGFVTSLVNNLPHSSVVVNVYNPAKPSFKDIASNNIRIIRPDLKLLNIKTTDVFQQTNLTTLMPKLVTWLKKYSLKDQLSTVNVQDVTFHQLKEYTEIPLTNKNNLMVLSMDSPGLVQVNVEDMFLTDACYVLVGGSSGLGLELAKYLSKNGAGYLALLSRHPKPISQSPSLQELESNGTKVMIVQADITDKAGLERSLICLRQKLKTVPIKGVFHGAVVLADRLLVNMSDDEFQTAVKPKILGAWNLHVLTKDDPLDYFVLHSSMASVFGNAGQSNYGAGNFFLDTLAHYRRRLNLPAQSINWSVLDLGVIEASQKVKQNLTSHGYLPLKIDDILRCFKYAMVHNQIQITFGNFQWSKISQDFHQKEYAHIRARFEQVIERRNPSGSQNSVRQMKKIGDEDKESGDAFRKYARELVGSILALEEDEIQDDLPLLSIGIDSMSAMTLQSHIRNDTGVDIPLVLLFESQTTVLSISNSIAEKVETSVSNQDVEHLTGNSKWFGEVMEDQANRFKRSRNHLSDCTSNIYVIFDQTRMVITGDEWHSILRLLMQQHAQLRTKYYEDSNFIFGVRSEVDEDFHVDIRELEDVDCSETAINCLKQASKIAFDLCNEYPFRTFLIRSGDQISHVCIVIHHIACDLLSLAKLMTSLKNVATDVINGQIPPVVETRREFQDYIDYFHQSLQSKEDTLCEFWEKLFAAPIEMGDHDFPLFIEEPTNFEEEKLSWKITTSESKAISRFSEQAGVTVFQLLSSLYMILLHKYSGSPDVVVSCQVNSRIHTPQFADVIGDYVTIVPIRQSFKDKKTTLRQCVSSTGDVINGCLVNSIYPFQSMKKMIKCNGKAESLLGHEVNWHERTAFSDVNSDTLIRIQEGVCGTNNVTRLWIVRDLTSNTFAVDFVYNSSCMSPAVAGLFFEDYKQLLFTSISHSDMKISEMTLQGLQETGRMQKSLKIANKEYSTDCDGELANNTVITIENGKYTAMSTKLAETMYKQMNNTTKDHGLSECLSMLFTSTAKKNPEKVCIINGGTKITFNELESHSNSISAMLQKHLSTSHTDKTAVFVELDDPVKYIACVLGIWKQGCSFYTGDLDSVTDVDGDIQAIITTRDRTSIHRRGIPVLFIEDGTNMSLSKRTSTEDNIRMISPAALVDVRNIDGKGKRCNVYHSAFVNRISWMWNEFTFQQNESIFLHFETNNLECWVILMAAIIKTTPVILYRSMMSNSNSTSYAVQLASVHNVTRIACIHDNEVETLIEYLERNSKRKETLQQQIKYIHCTSDCTTMSTLRFLALSLPTARIIRTFAVPPLIGIALYGQIQCQDASIESYLGTPITNAVAFILTKHKQLVSPGERGILFLGSNCEYDIPSSRREKYGEYYVINSGVHATLGLDGSIYESPEANNGCLTGQRNADLITDVLRQGIYLAVTSTSGLCKRTLLNVQDSGKDDGICLTWCKSNKKERRLPVHKINAIKLYEVNRKDVVGIETAERTYAFESFNSSDNMHSWMTELGKQLKRLRSAKL